MDFFGPSLEASLQDLKDIYRLLLEHHHGELEHNGFFDSLRLLLLEQATAEGVDVADDRAWLAWLCEPPGDDLTPPRDLLN